MCGTKIRKYFILNREHFKIDVGIATKINKTHFLRRFAIKSCLLFIQTSQLLQGKFLPHVWCSQCQVAVAKRRERSRTSTEFDR